jgi:hypothetical protein
VGHDPASYCRYHYWSVRGHSIAVFKVQGTLEMLLSMMGLLTPTSALPPDCSRIRRGGGANCPGAGAQTVQAGMSCFRLCASLAGCGFRHDRRLSATLRHSCRQNRSNEAAIRLIPECGANFHGPERCKRESLASAAADAASRLRPGISMGTVRLYSSYPTPCSNTRSRSSN